MMPPSQGMQSFLHVQHLVRPHLECSVQLCVAQYKRGVSRLQRRVIRMVKGLEHLSFEEKLRKLELFRLQRRKLIGDLTDI